MSDRHLNLGDTTLTSHTSPNLSSRVLLCAWCMQIVHNCSPACTTRQRRTGDTRLGPAQEAGQSAVSSRVWAAAAPDLYGSLDRVDGCPVPPSAAVEDTVARQDTHSRELMIRGRSWAGWAVQLGGLGSSLGGVAAGIWRRDDRGRERGLNKSGLLGRTGWFQRAPPKWQAELCACASYSLGALACCRMAGPYSRWRLLHPRAKSSSSEVTDWFSDGQSSVWARLLPFTRQAEAGRGRSRRWLVLPSLPKNTSATIFISYMWACKSHAD